MSDPATCRRVDRADIETLLSLLRAYWEYDGIAYRDAEVRKGLDLLLASPALGSAWLVDIRGRAVGYFILTWGFDLEFGGRHAWVTDLFIEPGHRGQGLGRQVLDFVDGLLRQEGVSCIELLVERDNAEALAFYGKLGFEAADRVPLARRVRQG